MYGYNIINYCTCVRNEFGLMFLKKDGDIVEMDIWGKVEALIIQRSSEIVTLYTRTKSKLDFYWVTIYVSVPRHLLVPFRNMCVYCNIDRHTHTHARARIHARKHTHADFYGTKNTIKRTHIIQYNIMSYTWHILDHKNIN